MGEAGVYTLFNKADGENAGGAVQRPDAPAAWYPYLAAGDVDASVEKAQKLGAQMFVQPFDIETVGRLTGTPREAEALTRRGQRSVSTSRRECEGPRPLRLHGAAAALARRGARARE